MQFGWLIAGKSEFIKLPVREGKGEGGPGKGGDEVPDTGRRFLNARFRVEQCLKVLIGIAQNSFI